MAGRDVMKRGVTLALASLLALSGGTGATTSPAAYVDPSQLDLPVPYFSFIRQPWRSYLEATPALTYLNGLGIVWNLTVPGRSNDQVAGELEWAGFRRVRYEIPWNTVRWDEEGLNAQDAARVASTLEAFKAHGLRPDILLNGHHGAPGPMHVATWRAARAIPAGNRELSVEGALVGIEPGWSAILSLGDSGHAGPLITHVSPDGTLTLSKPTARNVPAGTMLQIARLKYLPLYPVGTEEFEHTAAGWLRYVDCVIRLALENYGPDFDLEIWNELTFGSDFLDINHYYVQPVAGAGPDFLHPGGAAWELARRTVVEARKLDAAVRIIWGFSNTTFFHTAVPDLPPGVDAQSYHPYGTGPRCYAQMVAGKERYNVGGFVPDGCALMPEGWAQTFQQTETLMRALNPAARAAHPPGVARFEHFMTEHGVNLHDFHLADSQLAARARAKYLLRAPMFWLNKGVSGLYTYDVYDSDPLGFGVLQVDGGISPAMQALHRAVAHFAGAGPIAQPRRIDASVTRVAGPAAFYRNDPLGSQVQQQQMVVVLPFQSGERTFIVGLYVMTENFPADLPPQEYRVTIEGLTGTGARLEYYDPLADSTQPVRRAPARQGELSVVLALTDSPRLLEITEQ
jgi:hypothetical protein